MQVGSALLLVALSAGCGGTRDSGQEPLDPKKAAVLRFWRTFGDATARRMKGDCAGAVPIYKDALAADPKHEDSLYYLGQCLRNLGRYQEARETWTLLAEVNPHSARGHLALGALLASPEEGAPLDLKEAEEQLRRAHEINGEETGPMVRLGEVLLVQGRHEEALRWLQAAERSNPKSVEAPFLVGYLNWVAGDAAGAEAACRRAAKAGKTDAPIKGVLSEGDRKAAPEPGSVASGASPVAGVSPGATAAGGSGTNSAIPPKIAAPPLKEPMGKTLFGALASDLKSGPEVPDPLPPGFLDRTYRPVRAFVARLESRAAAFESADLASRK